jgi:thioredoxin reductase (NADPH)
MPEVLIYTKSWCPHCSRAKALLARKGVAYRAFDVEEDNALEKEMIAKAGGRTTVPQIFVGEQHVGGADDLYELESRGRLDELLGIESKRAGEVEMAEHQVVIIGSGPAGLTAAIYTSRANLEPVVVEGLGAGGQLMTTTEVDNYPGFPEGVQGPEMMERFKKQATRFGTKFVEDDATKVDFSSSPFRIWVGEQELRAKAVIVATGASPRKLNVKGEQDYAGRGVSYCATCDGFFFRGQEIMVVGGGDTAMEEAMFLARFGSRVTVIHRRDQFRASKIMAERVLKHDKIEVMWNSVAEEVLGDGTKVTAARIKNVLSGEITEHPCGGFFAAIGHTPNTALFEGILPMDEQGYLKVGKGSSTDIPGVFVAGDVHDHTYRQAVTASGAGCRAAIDCERWLEAEAG